MKSLTTRLNVVVSKAPVADRLRKFLTLSGATSGIIAISISPSSVCSVTHCPAIFSIGTPSKGSGELTGASGGLALAFFGVSTAGWVLGVCCALTPTTRRQEQTAGSTIRRKATWEDWRMEKIMGFGLCSLC